MQVIRQQAEVKQEEEYFQEGNCFLADKISLWLYQTNIWYLRILVI